MWSGKLPVFLMHVRKTDACLWTQFTMQVKCNKETACKQWSRSMPFSQSSFKMDNVEIFSVVTKTLFWNSGKYGRWKLSKTIWLVIAVQFNNDWWYLSASVCRNWKFANLKIHHQHWKVCRGSRDTYAPSRWQLFYFSNTVLMQTVSITTARLRRRVWVLNWPAFQMFHQLERFGGLWKIQQRNTTFLSQKSSSWFPRFPDFYRLIKEEGDVTQW